jgi:hypothetical protein
MIVVRKTGLREKAGKWKRSSAHMVSAVLLAMQLRLLRLTAGGRGARSVVREHYPSKQLFLRFVTVKQ